MKPLVIPTVWCVAALVTSFHRHLRGSPWQQWKQEKPSTYGTEASLPVSSLPLLVENSKQKHPHNAAFFVALPKNLGSDWPNQFDLVKGESLFFLGGT